jgi:hypothetical protein
MSKQKNEDQVLENQTDLTLAAGGGPAEDGYTQSGNPGDTQIPPGNPEPDEKDPDEKDNPEGLFTIEEYAERLRIDKPVFAAVMQAEKWAAGKKVPEADFKKLSKVFFPPLWEGEKFRRKKRSRRMRRKNNVTRYKKQHS